MPAGPGESLLATLFADVHYYFNDPSQKPQHHRFDRGSYVYLFHNPTENRVKLEVANHAGTPDQDAFSGYLDPVHITCSHKQPNLCTMTIDGASLQGHDQWHLPSYDEKHEHKYLYKIHALDLYLWTEKDGATLLNHLKSTLPAEKLSINDAPLPDQQHAEHVDSMSTVVQNLERTAISPQFTPERHESAASIHTNPGSPPAASPQPAAPLAYNPAAPAAPEPIAHREKTPPPLEVGEGTGLARYDPTPQPQYANTPNTFGASTAQYTPQFFSGPPQQEHSASPPSFPGPPQPHPSSGSLPPPPPPASSGSTPQPYIPSFAPPPTQANPASQPRSPPPSQQTFGAPVQRTATYPASPFGPHAQQQQQPPTPSSPPGYSPGTYGGAAQQDPTSYSNYSYSNGGGGGAYQQHHYNPGGAYTGDMHSQIYRPTSSEAAGHGHGNGYGRPGGLQKQHSETRQRVEEGVTRVEAKVGKYLKKLDRLW
ncbi:hypothetical protein BDY17DRAFT_322806 [Neohortaea acidophila]|uniref:RNA recognition motif-containing protein n=1 Tax=Neohortaea acidophila TaxID=245834 RepID=A0A6A6PVC3_9PEZI|nr:uncharacterized protein BDY17DRAFT_322806 [Neohortaea acidophila]KAF2483915.1 hypothetical protein BDY17DRAFT_322806 [Neohortaea acidophila]